MKSNKKKFKMILYVFCLVLLLALSGCKTSNVAGISLYSNIPEIQEQIENGILNVKVGNIDLSKYFIQVEYKDGKFENVPVTEDMIDENDIYKFYKTGNQEIRFYYDNFYIQATFDVGYNNFSDDIQFVSNDVYNDEECYTIEYDGKSHGLEIVGELPQGYQAYYKYGNSFSYCSDEPYEIEATITKEGYIDKTIKGKLRIIPKQITAEDLKEIVFEDSSYIYDGDSKKIQIENLPDFLNVTYKILKDGKIVDEAINVGDYIVEASLACNDNVNMAISKELSKITAELKIQSKIIDTKNLEVNTMIYEYTGKKPEIKVNGEAPEGVVIDLENIKYKTLTDEDVECPINVGEYIYTIDLKCDSNHTLTKDKLVSKIVISKKSIDLTEIKPINEFVDYTGEVVSYSLFGKQIPSQYSSLYEIQYKYYQSNGELCEPIEKGAYSVEIIISITNDNYEIKFDLDDKPLLIIR